MNEQTLIYNALDSAITHQCAQAFWKELQQGGYEDTYQFTIDLFGAFMYMEHRGIKVDQEALRVTREETQRLIEQKEEQLNEMCGRPINANSSKQVQAYFYIEKGIPPYYTKNTKGERVPTADDKALARIAKGTSVRKGFPEAKLMQEIRGLRKLMGTYLEIDFDEDSRFRCSINPRGTNTGRLSTSKTIRDTGMNAQNLPDAFKKFLVPDDGYMMLEIDKKQAEWVVVAYQCGDANMIDVLEKGEDCHIHTAHLMFKCPKDLILKDHKLVGHSTDPFHIEQLRKDNIPELFNTATFVPRIFSLRQGGKKSNHALNYDESYKRFALENEMTEKESKAIVQLYHQVYPNIRRNYEAIKTQLRHDRCLVNPFGRKRRFYEAWGDDLFKAAYAYIPQSTVADLLNRGILATYEDTSEDVYPFETLIQVHDSMLLQVPINIGPERIARGLYKIREYLNPTMEIGGREFTIGTDMKCSLKSWGDMDEVSIDGSVADIQRSLEAFLELAETKRLADRVS